MRGADAGWRVTRRALLAGGASLSLTATGLAGPAPLRIGVVEGLGLDAARLDQACRRLTGCAATMLPFASWAALRDHASAPAGCLIDGAVLPWCDTGEHLAVPLPQPFVAAIVTGPAAAGAPIGTALRHPSSDAALRALLPADQTGRLLELPPAALLPNLAAGLLCAVVLLGQGTVEAAPRLGLDVRIVGPEAAASLLPPLALVLRPDASRVGA